MKALLGRKKEMSQFFQPNGDVVPVTIVQAGPCTITQVKTADGKDKYCAYQLAFEDKLKNVAKPQAGQATGNAAPHLAQKRRSPRLSELQAGQRIRISREIDPALVCHARA